MINKTPTWVWAFVSVLAAVLIWSTSFVATKIGLEGFPPMTLAMLRLAISTAVLGCTAAIAKQIQVPSANDLIKISAGGFVGLTLYFCFENYGIKFTSASDAAILIASFPVITMFMESVFCRSKFSVVRIIGAVIAIGGVALVIKNGTAQNGFYRLIGDAFMILAGITWAAYNFITRSVVRKYSMLTLNFYQSLAATVLFIPFTFVEKSQWVSPTTNSVYALVYLGVVCSVVAYLFYNFGLRRLDSSSAVSVMNFIPVFGVIFSIVALHETVTFLQVVGGIIVVVGVSLSVRTNESPSEVATKIAETFTCDLV